MQFLCIINEKPELGLRHETKIALERKPAICITDCFLVGAVYSVNVRWHLNESKSIFADKKSRRAKVRRE